MSATESPALRPMSLGQLLDNAFRLYRRNFLTFIGIVAAMVIPVYVIYLTISLLSIPRMIRAMEELQNIASSDNPWMIFLTQMQAMGGGNSYVLSILSFFLIQGVATVALVKAIEDSYLGRPVDILGTYGKITKLLGPFFLVLLIEMLVSTVLMVWFFIPCIGWFTGAGMLIFASYVIFPMVPATVVIENQRDFGAIRRVWELTRRRFWWVLGYMLLLIVLASVITFGPSLLLGMAIGYLQETMLGGLDLATRTMIQTSASQVIQMVMQIIYLPIQLTATIVMYFDLRVRTEGFDLAMLAAEAEATDSDETALVTPAAPEGDLKSLVTGSELGYFFGITIGIAALCGIISGIFFMIMMALGAAMTGM